MEGRKPMSITAKLKQRAENLWDGGGPKKWYYALPILLLWLLIIWLIVKAVWL